MTFIASALLVAALAVDGNVPVAPVIPGFALDLFDGEMCHPGRLVCARKNVAFAKVSVFDVNVSSRKSELPAVFHNVWRAPDGTIAAILVNWTREPQHYELMTPDLTASGTLPPRSWRKEKQ